ncbi:urea ABC transporter permease subunit UrtB [Amorphus orientalis]|uniref:Urea transport system permease protein n=1 Tax=Amorphus orientalis TaxID=649198 RepID=A0AAE4ASC3_9HYPH|nr:urea ABC transporter permease subunit UrtB [Amorphus orientalis]MDQ0313844.1 urea transport system permease protein [Amorphus orientalis]
MLQRLPTSRFRSIPVFGALFCLVALLMLLAPDGARAQDGQDAEELRPLLSGLDNGRDFAATEAGIRAIAATGNPAAAPLLRALRNGDLEIRKSDNRVVLVVEEGRDDFAVDPLTGERLGELGRRDTNRISINNNIRNLIDEVVAGLTLRAEDPAIRRTAALEMLAAASGDNVEPLRAALAEEDDAGVRTTMQRALAASILQSDAPTEEKLEALETVAAVGDRQALQLLNRATADAELAERSAELIRGVERKLQMWEFAQNIWFGLSLGSVLLLAAIGLAITFGVMGVINMAHGEMVMLGAYTTFVVQEVIRQNFPELFGASLAIALPLAFCVAGLVGILIERTVIRFLYGRPLETLLATWGISLILQQTVRVIFGATNREVGNPDWMSGAFQLGGLSITYSRMAIVIFALIVFGLLVLLLQRTAFGLQIRAVTQNRKMASTMGIRTPWTDALTFGLGSGVAGIAGVALSQIDNVSPNLGQSYIIDSFLVVVFGGVGNLWGTFVGALSLGVLNKFLEPYAGAVLGKILVLVLIILFIQRRPRGLFPQKGRAAEG